MKNIRLLLIIVLYSGYAHTQQAPATKYFEGIVEYEINNKSYMQGVSDNELRERMGSTLRLYFKNGSYMREYIDGAGYTLRKFFYLVDKNMIYDYNPIASPDTLYLVDPVEPVYISYKIEPGNSETILNRECSSSIISAKYFFSFLPDTGNITMTYYFAPDLLVNPDWHKDMYIWKDVIKIHKSIALKFIEEDAAYIKQVFTATKIMVQPIEDEIFKIDPKLIHIKAPKL
jgi:hypothetical protein